MSGSWLAPCADGGCDCEVDQDDDDDLMSALDPVVIIHRDAQDSEVYWCGYTNGHDGQGWTAERREAMEFETFAEAGRERRRVKRMHPTMKIELERVP